MDSSKLGTHSTVYTHQGKEAGLGSSTMIISGSAFIGSLLLTGAVVLLIQKVNHGKIFGGQDPFGNSTNQGVQAQDNVFGIQIGGQMSSTLTWFLVILMIGISLFLLHSVLPILKQCARYNKEFKEMLGSSDTKDTDHEMKEEEEFELKEDIESHEDTNKGTKNTLKRNNSFYDDRCEETHWKSNPFRNTTPSPAHFYSTKGGEITDIPSSDSE